MWLGSPLSDVSALDCNPGRDLWTWKGTLAPALLLALWRRRGGGEEEDIVGLMKICNNAHAHTLH